ncbi:MAG TPA: hypothetical protein VMV44_11925 [Rectinemataceae bacterium]|nr:hypothetical protein [Rectinemataceae bacterium]
MKHIVVCTVAMGMFFLGPTLAADSPPIIVEPGYQAYALVDKGVVRAWFAIDSAQFRAALTEDEKLLLDWRLLEAGSTEIPKGLLDPTEADRDVLRFGLYAASAKTGKFRELPFDSDRPAYLWIPVSATKGQASKDLSLVYKEKAEGPWTRIRPLGSEATKSLRALRATGLLAYGAADSEYLVIRVDSWPLGDPYAILPGGH